MRFHSNSSIVLPELEFGKSKKKKRLKQKGMLAPNRGEHHA